MVELVTGRSAIGCRNVGSSLVVVPATLGTESLLVGEPALFCISKISDSYLLQALQKDKMAEAYSEIGMKGEVSGALSSCPWSPSGPSPCAGPPVTLTPAVTWTEGRTEKANLGSVIA